MIRAVLGAAGLILLGVSLILVRTLTYGAAPQGLNSVVLPSPPEISAEQAASRLSRAIQFRTITYKAGDPVAEAAAPWINMQTWLAEAYPRVHANLEIERVNGYSLLYRWAGTQEPLAPLVFMAHQDVVPVNEGTLEDWTGAPFSGEIIDGYVYGRGALDDKASMIAILEAGEALLETGFQPQRPIYFMFGHDEEVSGAGAAAMVDLLHARGVRAEMVLDEGFFVIEDSPLTGNVFGFIGVAEKGYITLRLTATARGGHSSRPPRNSANVQLARAIIALEENQMPADFSKAPIADLFRAAAEDMDFFTRMAFANRWLFGGFIDAQMAATGADAMLRTTTAPTMLTGSIKENVLPQRATALINFRVHPNDTIDSLMTHVRKVTEHIEGLEITRNEDGGIGSEASPVSPTDGQAYSVLAALARQLGDGAPVGPALVLGATDARWASKISDRVYRFVPARVTMKDTAGFHGTNERMSVTNMKRMSEGYAQIMLAMDGAQ